jgi:hypothetical protein
MLLPCCLQTKEGKKAKALTMAEFIDTMRELNRQCTAALRAATGNLDVKPLYIYDTVALQQNAAYAPMGFDRAQHVATPAHSPDFNKPIEHCWNQIKPDQEEAAGQDLPQPQGVADPPAGTAVGSRGVEFNHP